MSLPIRMILLMALLATSAAPAAAATATSRTVVITGANRGLGLEWAHQYSARGWRVIAAVRTPATATELKRLAVERPLLQIEQLDATDPTSVSAFAQRIRAQPVDVLVNNVGMLGDEPEQKLGALDAARFDTYMRVNVLSALLVTEALLPNLRAGQHKKVAGISARVASFAAYPRIHSGLYYYKASKTALNMVLRNLAMDLRADGIAVVSLSPGVVNTYGTEMNHDAMSPEMRASMTDIETSVGGMIRVLDGLDLAGSGKWYRFDGSEIDW
jgi:NAD(P)-dependent dehydrogenase (short-subunit alcohol dehydrogenase family)